MNLAVYVSEFESSYNVCLLDTNVLAIRMLGLNRKYRRLEGKSHESINKSPNRVNHRIQHRFVSSNFRPGPGWIRSFGPGTQKILNFVLSNFSTKLGLHSYFSNIYKRVVELYGVFDHKVEIDLMELFKIPIAKLYIYVLAYIYISGW